MGTAASLALPFFGLIFVGFLAGRFGRIPPDGLAGLNLFVVYFALPAMFFVLISRTPVEQISNWPFIVATTASTLIIFLVGFAIAMAITRGRITESTIQGLGAAYGNVGYMAPGLTLAAFGPAASVPTALIFCFDNALVFTLAPLGKALGGRAPGGVARLGLQILFRILTHPFILATIAGIAAAAIEFELPAPVDSLLTLLSAAAAPCALFAMGVAITMRPLRSVPVELPVLAFLKLIAHPILVYVMLSWIGSFDPVWVYTALLIASLPTATNVFVIAQQYDVWVERASGLVILTTMLSVGTVTGMLYLVGSGILPVDLLP